MKPSILKSLVRLLPLILIITSLIISPRLNHLESFPKNNVLGDQAAFLPKRINPLTTSRFTSKIIVQAEKIPFLIRVEKDPNLELGEERIVQTGKEGQIKRSIRITYYENQEFSREIVSIERREPIKEVIVQGTKMVSGETNTPDGHIRYQTKLRMWATSYDGHCPDCRGLTYSGTPVQHGVAAVDPNLIPLGTNLYVPGYGFARAEDIGGAIKGKQIDLGFEDLSQGTWSARWIDVYLLE
jgi:3D (Asp-Asp-Asp) domain-containing protein